MNRTRLATLLGAGLAGLVIGFLIETGLAATGHAILMPPVTLTVTLTAIGVIVVILAWPVRRAVHGDGSHRVDPFRAARTAALAKACAVAGALLSGIAGGVLLYVATRPVVAVASSLWLSAAALFGALVLMAGGLVAEWFCALKPPSDGDDARDGTAPTTHPAAPRP